MENLWKSVIDQDREPIVLCDGSHTIVYLNPAAEERYRKRGGRALVGRCLLDCHNAASREAIEKVMAWFREDRGHNRMFTYRNVRENKEIYMIALRDEAGNLIGYYEKHESREPERGKPYDFSGTAEEILETR